MINIVKYVQIILVTNVNLNQYNTIWIIKTVALLAIQQMDIILNKLVNMLISVLVKIKVINIIIKSIKNYFLLHLFSTKKYYNTL